MNDARPTYRIPAREVVPRMLLRVTSAYLWPVLAVGRHDDGTPWLEVDRGDYEPRRYGFRSDEVVTVELPGPSPRELACTCCPVLCSECLDLGALTPKTAGVIGKDCERTGCRGRYRKARVSGAEPLRHGDCPVAEVPGRHGGMRLWPAPWGGEAWTWDGRKTWVCEMGPLVATVTAQDVAAASVPSGRDAEDTVLQCFYLPPEVQPEPREPTPWAPHAGYEDLAVRYG